MNILVIGKNSQVGLALAQALMEKKIQFTAFNSQELDITNHKLIKKIITLNQPSIIINTSGYHNAVMAENKPSQCFLVNRDSVSYLANQCNELNIPLIHISNYRVFNGAQETAYKEDDTLSPQGVLATSFAHAEQQIRDHCSRHIILRLSWIISLYKKNLLIRILNKLESQENVFVTSDQIGSPTPACDIARVLIAIMQQINCGANVWGTYHYCSSDQVSKNEFTEIILNEAKQLAPLKVKHLSMNKADNKSQFQSHTNTSLDCTKIKRTFGIHQRTWRYITKEIIQKYFKKKA